MITSKSIKKVWLEKYIKKTYHGFTLISNNERHINIIYLNKRRRKAKKEKEKKTLNAYS
jgi:hypothetical protein